MLRTDSGLRAGGVVRTYGNIGVCAYFLGDLDTAIARMEKALAILLRHRAASDSGNLKFNQNFPALYGQKEDAQKAAEYQRKAADAARP